MGDTATPQGPRPLELERVQSSRADVGELRLRLSGRWLDERTEVGDDEELLVINVEGRRHRFPVSREERSDREPAPGRWSASFRIPTWAEPREEGQAALWLGNAVIPVPPMHESREATAVRTTAPYPPQRTADAVQIRAELANAHSELDARSSRHDQLETTLGELRGELDRLREAVQDQRRQLRERSAEVAELREHVTAAEAAAELRTAEASALRGDLATASVSRDAAVSEAAGLRSELGRVGSELAVTREQVDVENNHLHEANRLLADARALAEELRADDSDR
jgi:septal ring factor EnvC (AmiA/AmiB activator)